MKLPWYKRYPNDWLRDTRHLSHTARSVWNDIMEYAHNEPQRGVYQRSVEAFCRELNLTEVELVSLMSELATVADVTFSNKSVTVMSRRMIREEKAYQMNRNRVAKHRMKRKCNESVTPKTLDVRRQTSQTSERLTSKSLLRSPSPSPSPDAPAQPTARSAESALDKTKKLLQPLAVEQPVIPPEPEVIIPHSVELFFQGKCPCLMCERKIGWPLRGTR